VNGLSFSSPFTESVFSLPPRPRSFAERTLDELTSMSGQQLLGLPLTAPITALGGAVRGVSFGLLDPTQEIAEGLGDFAPPQIARSALEIAGEIGGSFVPYIGAASVASKAFRGLDLSSKLLRGATTFGAPEILRQALHGEFNPQSALQSLATGAAFSLPGGRARLIPAVFATTLATGGSLLEAGTAAGFAALFGPMQGTAKKAFGRAPAADGVTAQPALRPEIDLSDFVALRKLKAARQASEVAPEFAEAPVGPLAEVRTAFARDDILREGLRPRSQVELVREAATMASPPKTEAVATLASTVELLAKNSPEELTSGLTKAIEVHGPTSQQAKTVQLALAESKGGYVPGGAPVQNSLGTTSKGIDIIDPDPTTNPFVQRLAREKIVSDLRASGDPLASAQAAQIEKLWLEVRSKRKGGTITLADANEFLRRQDEVLTQSRVNFRDDDHAFETFAQEAASHASTADLGKFAEALPEHYRNRGQQFATRIQKHLVGQARIAARIEAEGLVLPPDQLEAGLAAGNYGAAVHPVEGRVGLAVGGQDIGRRFKNYDDARGFVNELESGAVQPANIHELRMLAHARGIVVDYDGSGVQLVNNLTGEVVAGNISSPNEALALIRRAPRLVDDAPDLTPPAFGQTPGPGHIGGVATESAPASCTAVTDLVASIFRSVGE